MRTIFHLIFVAIAASLMLFILVPELQMDVLPITALSIAGLISLILALISELMSFGQPAKGVVYNPANVKNELSTDPPPDVEYFWSPRPRIKITDPQNSGLAKDEIRHMIYVHTEQIYHCMPVNLSVKQTKLGPIISFDKE